jgi:hypothetical protein
MGSTSDGGGWGYIIVRGVICEWLMKRKPGSLGRVRVSDGHIESWLSHNGSHRIVTQSQCVSAVVAVQSAAKSVLCLQPLFELTFWTGPATCRRRIGKVEAESTFLIRLRLYSQWQSGEQVADRRRHSRRLRFDSVVNQAFRTLFQYHHSGSWRAWLMQGLVRKRMQCPFSIMGEGYTYTPNIAMGCQSVGEVSAWFWNGSIRSK